MATKMTTPKRKAQSTIGEQVPAVPQELIDAIRSRKCGLYVGAGLSAGAGYPSWTKLLSDLVDIGRAKNYQINAAGERELKNLIEKGDKLLLVAEELKERFGHHQFEIELVNVFSAKKKPTKTHKKLMKIPFRFAITTNYDLLLEEAYVSTYKEFPQAYTNLQPSEIADALWRDDYFILKAHGDIKNRSSMVITERDYREIIYRSHGYRSALSSIFTTRTILFLGVSLADPELRLLLSYLHDAFHGGRTHYALVSKKEFSTSVANRWRKDFGIVCLCYQPTKDHPQVHEFVSALLRSTNSK